MGEGMYCWDLSLVAFHRSPALSLPRCPTWDQYLGSCHLPDLLPTQPYRRALLPGRAQYHHHALLPHPPRHTE